MATSNPEKRIRRSGVSYFLGRTAETWRAALGGPRRPRRTSNQD